MSAPTHASAEAARDGRRAQLALLAVVTYAVFRNGATGLDAAAWTISLTVLLGLVLLVICLRPGAAAPRVVLGGRVAIALLVGFALWSGLTLLWSVDPSGTWRELNRAVLYAVVVAIAVVATSLAGERGIERIAHGLLALSIVVGLYALGGKIIPGFHLFGLIDLNHTRDLARLRAPLGYWNALALLCATGIPIALRVACDLERSRNVRLGMFAAIFLLITTQFMTYSRGGLLALLSALAVLTILGRHRLRALLVMAVATACALPAILYAFAQDDLVANGAPLGVRQDAGWMLLIVLIICLGVLMTIAWWMLRFEPRVRWQAAYSRRIWRGLAIAAAGFVLVSFVGAAAGEGGLSGAIDRATSSFTEDEKDEKFDPGRVITTNSGNRWTWWKEAAGAFSDRPVGGWGAGSFSVTHRLYREDQLAVAQPHSVPLQFLSETGMIGGLLALGGIALLLWTGLRRILALPPGRTRDLAVPLLAAGVGWVVHGIFDWDWSLPGATLPAMVALGTVAALPARPTPPRERSIEGLAGIGAAPGRWALAALAALVATAAIGSAVLPARAEGVAQEAETIAGDREDAVALEQAAARADLAARLDPLSVRPLFVGAAIARGRGRLLEARDLLLEAVDRQPYSAEAWYRLSLVALALADFAGFRDAAQRALENDPASGTARGLVRRAEIARTPSSASATATGTPLPAGGVVAPPPAATPQPGTSGAVPGTTTPGATTPGATAPGTTTPGPTVTQTPGVVPAPGTPGATTP